LFVIILRKTNSKNIEELTVQISPVYFALNSSINADKQRFCSAHSQKNINKFS